MDISGAIAVAEVIRSSEVLMVVKLKGEFASLSWKDWGSTFSIQACGITDEMALILASGIAESKSLKLIDMSGMNALYDIPVHGDIEITANKISPIGALGIAQALRQNTSLGKLIIDGRYLISPI